MEPKTRTGPRKKEHQCLPNTHCNNKWRVAACSDSGRRAKIEKPVNRWWPVTGGRKLVKKAHQRRSEPPTSRNDRNGRKSDEMVDRRAPSSVGIKRWKITRGRGHRRRKSRNPTPETHFLKTVGLKTETERQFEKRQREVYLDRNSGVREGNGKNGHTYSKKRGEGHRRMKR